MKFEKPTWNNRTAYLLLATILLVGCVPDFEDFAYSCAGVPLEYLSDSDILFLMIIYARFEGSVPPGLGIRQNVEAAPGFVTVRIRPDGTVSTQRSFNAPVRGAAAVVHPLADAHRRMAGGEPSITARRIYFSDTDNNSVRVFDPVAGSLVANVRVGGEPRGLAISPDGSRLYVGNKRSATVSVVDTATLQTLDPIRLPAGSEPFGLAIMPDGAKLYVANEAGNGSVFSIDLASINTAQGAPPIEIATGRGARQIAISPDGSLAYITNTVAGSVAILDTLTDTVVSVISVSQPSGVAFSPNGNHVYVSSASSRGRVLAFETGGAPTPVREWQVGDTPVGMALSPDGSLLAVANRGSDFLSLIRARGSEPPQEIPVREGFGALTALQPAP